MTMASHLAAFSIGALLDLIIGDPHSIPHPVMLIGKLIHALDIRFRAAAVREEDRAVAEKKLGTLLVLLVLAATGFFGLAPSFSVLPDQHDCRHRGREHHDLPDPCGKIPCRGERKGL